MVLATGPYDIIVLVKVITENVYLLANGAFPCLLSISCSFKCTFLNFIENLAGLVHFLDLLHHWIDGCIAYILLVG